MMNSYEFDQPLDLRLKALNLSLSPYQKNYPALAPSHMSSSSTNSSSGNIGSCGNISIGQLHHDRSLSNNLNFDSNNSLSTANSNSQVNLAPHQPQIAISNPIPMNMSSTCLNLHQNTNTNHNNHQPHRLSPLISHQYSPNMSGSPQGSSSHLRHFRPSNIHCQPLNHHQPHPLSRLHPPPPPPPPPPSTYHLEQAHQQQDSSPRIAPQAHPQQPQLTLPTIEQQKQTSPQQHHHHMSHYHPMLPIGRSLSLSCHPLKPTFSLSSTSPTSNHQYLSQQPQLISTNNVRCTTQSPERGSMLHHQHSQPNFASSSDITKQSLMRLGINPASSNSPCGPFVSQDRITPGSPNSRSPPSSSSTATASASSATSNTATTAPSCLSSANATTLLHDAPNNQQQMAGGNNTASPITRQHSLVSKYNCKPCGIVFSQPETLRAHQESYCTKRDRAHHQTQQIRSQSAVSPSALAQQQQGGASGGQTTTPTLTSGRK